MRFKICNELLIPFLIADAASVLLAGVVMRLNLMRLRNFAQLLHLFECVTTVYRRSLSWNPHNYDVRLDNIKKKL